MIVCPSLTNAIYITVNFHLSKIPNFELARQVLLPNCSQTRFAKMEYREVDTNRLHRIRWHVRQMLQLSHIYFILSTCANDDLQFPH
jgi:hypothetical protein